MSSHVPPLGMPWGRTQQGPHLLCPPGESLPTLTVERCPESALSLYKWEDHGPQRVQPGHKRHCMEDEQSSIERGRWEVMADKCNTAGQTEAPDPHTFPSRVRNMQRRIQNTGESRYLGSPRHGFKRRLVQKEPKNQIHIRKNSFILNCRLQFRKTENKE